VEISRFTNGRQKNSAKILTYKPKRREKIGHQHLRRKNKHTLQEGGTHGLIHKSDEYDEYEEEEEEEEEEDDDDDDDDDDIALHSVDMSNPIDFTFRKCTQYGL
jgi:hypothetical protein